MITFVPCHRHHLASRKVLVCGGLRINDIRAGTTVSIPLTTSPPRCLPLPPDPRSRYSRTRGGYAYSRLPPVCWLTSCGCHHSTVCGRSSQSACSGFNGKTLRQSRINASNSQVVHVPWLARVIRGLGKCWQHHLRALRCRRFLPQEAGGFALTMVRRHVTIGSIKPALAGTSPFTRQRKHTTQRHHLPPR